MKGVLAAFLIGGFLLYAFHDKIKKTVPFLPEAKYVRLARAYEANSQYHDLAMNPYFLKYGPYGSYFGSGYDSYLSNWSPK